ncbi:hypothetical protein M5K25_006122 [Dendrobium thyrsiflorum]|uniref:DEAD-box ATP-dependent RNA helicase 13 n=1 Tax=Dendrobium thyrsiflorum TaxID=117978 RepID=A0ABD0VAK6_DENTH
MQQSVSSQNNFPASSAPSLLFDFAPSTTFLFLSVRKLRHFDRKDGSSLAVKRETEDFFRREIYVERKSHLAGLTLNPAQIRLKSCCQTAPEDIIRSDAMDEVSLSPSSTFDTRKKNPKRRWKQKIANKSKSFDSHRLDFLPWNQAESGGDPFALLSGGVEGGFLSLEEIDESEYCLFSGSPDIGSVVKAENTTSSKLKKRKRVNVDAESEGDDSCVVNEEDKEEKGCKKKKRRRKKRSNDHKANELIPDGEPEQQCEPAEGSAKGMGYPYCTSVFYPLLADSNKTNAESDTDDEPFGDDGMCAWNELRLHPLLIKSIRRLGFIKPTPIQKACIPVAAHHGKDVIGAAQTGSGKTLAFGLPILQRLLEEREKARRLLENGTEVTGGFGESHLRALILAPTRELAFQLLGISFEALKELYWAYLLRYLWLLLLNGHLPILWCWPLGFLSGGPLDSCLVAFGILAGWLFLCCRLGLCAEFWGLFLGSSVPFFPCCSVTHVLLLPWPFWLAGLLSRELILDFCAWLLAFPLPLFFWLTWNYCWVISSFPIYSGCFVEKRLVDFGEFISRNLRVYLACELVFFFVSSYKSLRVFFVLASNLFLLYASDHSICILLLSIFKAQKLVVWKVVGREQGSKVSDHLKKAAKYINVRVVSIVGGMYSEKQERLLRRRPEIVVGTPGRLWELMSGGNEHLVELHSLSFFVLDEADRMIENGHFNELQSIIDMLPTVNSNMEQTSETNKTYKTTPNLPRKKRQTFVFSATVALSDNFRKKLKRTLSTTKSTLTDGLTSIEKLSERAGMRPDVAIIDLTNTSIVADKLVESFIECGEDEKDAYLYYILSVHRKGRTIVFCTSIAALRHISSLLHLLDVNAWTLHAQMQQRARLKAMDRFRENEHGVLIATDVAARGLDIPGIRTVIHYQLPHSAEVYIHRSGRTARSSFDGCSIALISPSDKAKFSSLCKSLSKESLQEFCVDSAYMPDVVKRISLARRIDKIQRKISQESAKKSWFQRNAANVELAVDDTDSEEEREMVYKQKKTSFFHLKQLQQGLIALLSRPMQPKAFSHRFFAATGVSPLVQQQLEELSKAKLMGKMGSQEKKTRGLLVIGQDCVEPLQALRSSGREVCVNVDKKRETRRLVENWKNKRREEKKREREQRRKARKKARQGMK